MANPATGASGATTFTLFKNGRLPIPSSSYKSAVDEPSSINSGRDIMVTGNWYAGYSHNAGATYSWLDPFSIFGSGYCCDQQTALDVGHNRVYWLSQYGDHLAIANSDAGDLANWCEYNMAPSNFGLPAGTSFDYNRMATSTRWLYVTTNVYGDPGVSDIVFRMDLDQSQACGQVGFQWFTSGNDFSDDFAQPAADTMLIGTNWAGDISVGSQFVITRWDDVGGSILRYVRNIASFTGEFRNDGHTCASQDGVVTNWCQFSDSRMTNLGYVAGIHRNSMQNVVGWAFNASSDSGHPFPYIRRVYFRTSDLSYIGASELYATWGAFQDQAMASDGEGHVGFAAYWGGGTGTSHYYPASLVGLDDDVAPNQPWAISYAMSGAGNACYDPNNSNLTRWGDYLDIHPLYPQDRGFRATGYTLTSTAAQCFYSTPSVSVGNIAFGRNRDQVAYTRWNQ